MSPQTNTMNTCNDCSNCNTCDAVDDEMISTIMHMQEIVQNVHALSQQSDKTELDQYCKAHEYMIRFILKFEQEGDKPETIERKNHFRQLVSSHITV
tara:strand:- start:3470 stop:3760 length:291 start_codon:yes stop_codon:yes gene_type:complete